MKLGPGLGNCSYNKNDSKVDTSVVYSRMGDILSVRLQRKNQAGGKRNDISIVRHGGIYDSVFRSLEHATSLAIVYSVSTDITLLTKPFQQVISYTCPAQPLLVSFCDPICSKAIGSRQPGKDLDHGHESTAAISCVGTRFFTTPV
jgi:hypothetical protein